jgi:outer membrane cobalamin receptor
MKKKPLLTLVSFIGIMAHAQNKFTIHISDSATGTPLENVLVILPGKQSYLSNSLGEVTIQNADDSSTVLVSSIGYLTIRTNCEALRRTDMVALLPSICNLEEVVVTGHHLQETGTLSKIDLKTRPVASAQDVLRVVPGLFIAQHQGGGKAEQIFIRGFDNDHGTDIAVSTDGIPINLVSHAHGQGYNDMHFIIPEIIEQIDYGTGPYYANVGNLNTSGYVKINTINALTGSSVKVEAGMFNNFRIVGLVDLLSDKLAKKGAHWYTAGEFMYYDGPFELPQALKRRNLFSKFHTQLGTNHQLTLSVSFFDSKWFASGQIPQRAVDSGLVSRFGVIDKEKGATGRWNANAQLKTRINTNTWMTNQFYFSRYNFDLYSNFTFFLLDTTNGDQIQQFEKRNLMGIQSKLNSYQYWGKWQGSTEVGLGIRHDDVFNLQLNNTRSFKEIKDRLSWGDINETNYFAYASQQIRNDRWLLSLAIRFDGFQHIYIDKLNTGLRQNAYTDIISPKLTVQYTVNEHTQLYLKTGKGFHSNDTRVVLARQGRDILPAAYGSDLGIILKQASGILINVAAWYLYLQQEFVYVGDAAEVEPAGRTIRKGLDISARIQFLTNLQFYSNINYSYGRSVDEPKGNDFIPLAPSWSSMGGIIFKSRGPVSASLQYRYLKDRPANAANSLVAEGYFVNDLVLNYTQKKFEIGLVIENLFNTKWREAQFETETRLKNEPFSVNEVCFTPGTPFYARARCTVHL